MVRLYDHAIDYLEKHGFFFGLCPIECLNTTLYNYFNVYSGVQHSIEAAVIRIKSDLYNRTIQTWQSGFTKLLQELSSGRFFL